jgi:N-acetylneuraminate synthase
MRKPFDLQSYSSWDSPAFIIAEAGVNHEGDMQKALHLIDLAAESGVDAIKFQTYKAGRIASRYSPSYWDTSKETCTNQYDLFRRYDQFDAPEYQKLAEECQQRGVMFLSTPFDIDCIEWLEPLLPLWKIASADIANFLLLERVARTGKPVLLSTGAANISEAERARDFLMAHGCPQVSLLHCVLSYPTSTEHANIAAIQHMRQFFPDTVLGYSDHTTPVDSFAAISAAYVLGARMIEKHFTFDKSLPGNDHYHAFDATDFKRLRQELEQVRTLLGTPHKQVLPWEEVSRLNARRSLVARQAIPRGTTITRDMIDVKRPGTGIEPRYLEMLEGMVAAGDIGEDAILQWHMVADAGVSKDGGA